MNREQRHQDRPRVIKRPKKPADPAQYTLQDLIRQFDIGSNWDAIIVGDGSGTTWEKQMGWGSVLIMKTAQDRIPFYGGMSHGTNNMAEILAVLHPLMYLTQHIRAKKSGFHVHILSDSSYVVRGLEITNPATASELKSNRELWMAIHFAIRQGLIIHPHHVHRDTIELNKLGHDLANIARKQQHDVLNQLTWDTQGTTPG